MNDASYSSGSQPPPYRPGGEAESATPTIGPHPRLGAPGDAYGEAPNPYRVPVQPPASRRRPWLVIGAAVFAVVITIITVVLVTSGGGNHWSQATEGKFLADCTAGNYNATSTCICLMHHLEAQYSENDFVVLDGQRNSDGQLPLSLQKSMLVDLAKCS